MKKIVVGITGSIASYKAIDLVNELNKKDYDVEVIMTDSACHFVAPLTIQTLLKKEVYVDIYDNHPERINHIDLVRDADLFIIVPCSANTLAKISYGLADNLLTAAFLAATCKKIIAPAMNVHMYENKATQDNIQRCKDLGIEFIEPETGLLACGDTGKGKLASLSTILDDIDYSLCDKPLMNKNVLVSAGPTIEAIDPVRYITNHSSGKMGYAIAKAAYKLGANVTLISGPTALTPVPVVKTIKVNSAKEMYQQCITHYSNQNYVIMAAAVGDYCPIDYHHHKIKKENETLTIQLKKNPDILKYLGQHKEKQILCGFAMETDNLIENAKEKCLSKNCDMLVANSLNEKDAGFRSDTNKVTLIFKDKIKDYDLMPKEDLAYVILEELMKLEER